VTQKVKLPVIYYLYLQMPVGRTDVHASFQLLSFTVMLIKPNVASRDAPSEDAAHVAVHPKSKNIMQISSFTFFNDTRVCTKK
jgi:hypothetical protein